MNINVKAIKNGVKKSTTVNVDFSKNNCKGGAFVSAARKAIVKLGFATANHSLESAWIDNTPAFYVIKIAQGGHREIVGTVKFIVSMRKIKSAFGE